MNKNYILKRFFVFSVAMKTT